MFSSFYGIMKRFFVIMTVSSFFYTSLFYGILQFAFMKRFFFMRMHVFLFLRHSTEFCGIRIYGEILDENACSPLFTEFYGIQRNLKS